MQADDMNILIAGEAGQGLVTIGQMLAKALVRSGLMIHVSQSYHSRVRGGHNTYAVRVSPRAVAAPADQVDLCLALNSESIGLHGPELSESGLMLVQAGEKGPEGRSLEVPFSELADKRYENTVGLGVLGALLGLDEKLLSELVSQMLKKHPDQVEPNQQALAKARAWASERKGAFPDLPQAQPASRRVMLNGNEAIALGAMSAGVKLCAFYPMTPSTSIALTLAANADRMGLVVEQVEDEIAAINMAIGGSYAGAPSMICTSGGGLALMVEGISLAGMTETPVVLALAQRPGPATGLPTRTEQGDLEMVLHAGHGEFARAVFAPGSPEQCFHLTRRAFEIAQRWQSPVFVLTDQYLADNYRAIEGLEVADLEPVGAWVPVEGRDPDYLRYRFNGDGLSPRRLPGLGPELVAADSDEHTEDGHITEDLTVRVKMMDKRLKKLEGMAGETMAPDYSGPENPELLLVCWGSSLGPVSEAAARLTSQGRPSAVLHFGQVWPLAPEQFLGRLQAAGQVVMVEGNAFGQMARLIRRESGFYIKRRVLRYDGLPFTPGYILKALEAQQSEADHD